MTDLPVKFLKFMRGKSLSRIRISNIPVIILTRIRNTALKEQSDDMKCKLVSTRTVDNNRKSESSLQ